MTEVFQLDDIHKHMFREKPKPTASGWSFSLVRDGNGKAIPILANAMVDTAPRAAKWQGLSAT